MEGSPSALSCPRDRDKSQEWQTHMTDWPIDSVVFFVRRERNCSACFGRDMAVEGTRNVLHFVNLWRMSVLWVLAILRSYAKLFYARFSSSSSSCRNRAPQQPSGDGGAVNPSKAVCIVTGVSPSILCRITYISISVYMHISVVYIHVSTHTCTRGEKDRETWTIMTIVVK